MTTLLAEQALVLRDLAGLPGLRVEHPATLRVVAALSGERMEFRPSPGARSAGELARHIVGAELRFLTAAAYGEFPDSSGELARLADGGALVEWYRPRFEAVLQRLAAASAEDLLRVLDYKGLIRMPALGFLQFALNHTIHHRGQLSVYLRSMGAPVPSIYG